MERISVTIKGTSPLLQNRFDEAVLEKKSTRKRGVVVEDNPENKLYKLPNGKVYQPADMIKACLVKISTSYPIRGQKRKTYKDLVKACLFVTPEAIVHENQKFTIDTRSGVNPNTRGRVIIKRPRFDKWRLSFCIEINDEQLPIEVIKEMLDDAGRTVGIGDYRPRFGRFMVEEFKEK